MEKSVGLQNFNTSNVTIQQNTSTFEDYTTAFQEKSGNSFLTLSSLYFDAPTFKR